jgi:hydrogenase expression/formation protein HypE
MSTTTTPRTDERIVLAHGGGGELMHRLIREHIVPPLANQALESLADGAILPKSDGQLVFTTDSYVVSPLEFPGGDIGRLAVAGTVNDLAVMGARPLALSLGLILEEGLRLEVLDRVLASVASTAAEAGVSVVTGDTKVVERRSTLPGQDPATPDGLFINTAGIGSLDPAVGLEPERMEVGDAILINGPIAEHGLSVMSVRSGIEFDSDLRTDAAPLNSLIAGLLDSGARVKFLRDATRGGLAGVLADICEARALSLEIEESRVPISPTARHAAEMLGLDPLATANEGKVVCVVAGPDADRALETLRRHRLGRHAECIGKLTDARPPLVELITRAGGRRVIQRPYGEDLPRIC